MTYTDQISRDASNDPLVPLPVTQQIIKEMTKTSAVQRLARNVRMSSKTQRQPVLSVLPTAYFVSGDTGLKQTTAADWTNLDLVAEEIAVIVPIPEAYIDDAQYPIWSEVRPLLVEAIGVVVDAACLFGVNKPSTWGNPVYQTALAAGNFVVAGAGDDLAADVSAVAQQVVADGGTINGFITEPGFNWQLVDLRSTDGVPIYQPNLRDGPGGSLYGYPLQEVANGAWDSTEAFLLAGDWNKAIFGIRQDITFKLFTEGVIQNGSGDIVLNLMQQDSVAMRVVMRCAWQIANPPNRLNTNAATRSAFGVLQKTTANS